MFKIDTSDPFLEAMAHHRAGRLDQAAAIYQGILATNPAHANCLNLLGVIAHQKGAHQRGVELIQQAILVDNSQPSFHVNLATAFRALGKHDEAVAWCQSALVLQPDLAEARLALGLSLQALKRWPDAEAHFRWMSETSPNDSRGPQTLGNCLREQGRTDEAIAAYREALARNPNDAAAHLGIGTILVNDRNAAVAEGHLRRAVELLPREVTAWTNYGTCLVKLAKEREAVPVFEQALRLAPNDPRLGVNLGLTWLGCGDYQSAENCFNTILKFHPDYAGALSGLADIRKATDRTEEAIPLYERALQLEPTGPFYKGLADAYWESGDVDRAVAILHDGIARHPDDPENHVRLAVMLAAGGNLKGAEEAYRKALEIRPGYPVGLIGLAQTLRAKLPPADAIQLSEVLKQPLPDFVRAGAHFGLAQVTDANNDFATAAEHLRQANALTLAYNAARGKAHDPDKFTQDIDRIIKVFQPEFLAKVKRFGVKDERPVFVVGMPRSGTTLIEQILASHPRVFGAGERRFAHQSLVRLAREHGGTGDPLDCLADLTKDKVQRSANWHLEQLQHLDRGRAARVVDKMPENYMLLGWLAVQFPKARFIHSRRDIRDVALSCWMTNFTMARWANDLEQIASRVRNYLRIMEHWRKVLPVPMLEMDYEKLVADQEGESRKLVSWLGLKWDPACLSFYQTERLVKTASVTQVRQPMYARSVGRWEHYRDVLQPFLKAVGM